MRQRLDVPLFGPQGVAVTEPGRITSGSELQIGLRRYQEGRKRNSRIGSCHRSIADRSHNSLADPRIESSSQALESGRLVHQVRSPRSVRGSSGDGNADGWAAGVAFVPGELSSQIRGKNRRNHRFMIFSLTLHCHRCHTGALGQI
jgi:hypothetical protein